MRALLTLCLAIVASLGYAATNKFEVQARSFPGISYWDYRPDIAARVANSFIVAGESNALAALTTLTSTASESGAFIYDEKLCHLCRLLFFHPESGKELRPPIRGLASPYPVRGYEARRWPAFPFAIVDGIPLSMIVGYSLAGVAESSAQYLAYCRHAGTMRTTLYPIPTVAAVSNAINTLLDSRDWKSLGLETPVCGPNRHLDVFGQLHSMRTKGRSLPVTRGGPPAAEP